MAKNDLKADDGDDDDDGDDGDGDGDDDDDDDDDDDGSKPVPEENQAHVMIELSNEEPPRKSGFESPFSKTITYTFAHGCRKQDSHHIIYVCHSRKSIGFSFPTMLETACFQRTKG